MYIINRPIFKSKRTSCKQSSWFLKLYIIGINFLLESIYPCMFAALPDQQNVMVL